jgi:RNA-directed DNA polymerase
MHIQGRPAPKKKVCNFVGGVVSPLLANIYLHEVDRYMESNYLNLSHYERKKRRKQGKSNFLYCRYADDFVVLCNGTRAQALEMKEELKGVLEHMGLKLSEEKTKVTHITEGFDFLGYRIIRGMGRSGKMAPKVKIPRKAIKRFQDKIHGILAPNRTHESVNAKILVLNGLIRGWCEYYRITSGPSQVFGKLAHEIFEEMGRWLAKKYDTSKPTIMQKFAKENPCVTFGTQSRRLVMPVEYKNKKLLVRTWHNPYTEKEKVKEEKDRIKRESLFSYDALWTGKERGNRSGEMDLREELLYLKGPRCQKCGNTFHPSELQMDHIVARARFKKPTEAERLENQQLLCTDCHRAKTKADLKVLSRMR